MEHMYAVTTGVHMMFYGFLLRYICLYACVLLDVSDRKYMFAAQLYNL
jgi:hypothetical protein